MALDLPRQNTQNMVNAAVSAHVATTDPHTQYTISNAGKTLQYTGDLLTLYTDAFGTKTFSYDGNGRLTGVVGTGRYVSKTFVYTGDKLTSVTVP